MILVIKVNARIARPYESNSQLLNPTSIFRSGSSIKNLHVEPIGIS